MLTYKLLEFFFLDYKKETNSLDISEKITILTKTKLHKLLKSFHKQFKILLENIEIITFLRV